ncbi:MAG: hypothetical protein ACXVQ6_06515 [Actinomycetota bacterium]
MPSISCRCGTPLVEEITDRGVRPVGGGPVIPFRRTTDYVMCPSCLRTYDVPSLVALAESSEIIDSLERLADQVEGPETDRG